MYKRLDCWLALLRCHRVHERFKAGEMSFAEAHRYVEATVDRCHSPGTPLSW